MKGPLRLFATGPEGRRDRFELKSKRGVRVGRAPQRSSESDAWAISWDAAISRSHAELRWADDQITVVRLEGARNPIFFKGEAADLFALAPGDHFVIGDTTFGLIDTDVEIDSNESAPVDVVGYSGAELQETRYRNADERLEVLSSLPHVLRGAGSREELYSRLVLLLLEGVPSAGSAAIVRLHDDELEVCHWDGRDASVTKFQPSRRLILDAIQKRHQSVRSLWRAESGQALDYTISDELAWAFCTPVPGDACAGWGLYVAGRSGSLTATEGESDLRQDLKFTELVASILGAVLDVRDLQVRESTLSRFFSPVALPMLSGAGGEEALAPRQTEVTILFCDLRGFSRESERSRDDLLGLLQRVSHALDVMTQCIHAYDGVIVDFQGDAALAFWGWPLDNGRSAIDACQAALAIRERFARAAKSEGDPLGVFRCGVGLATGEAVAGRLGSSGQFKIDVFGPVVNLASRLEGITKQVRVPVLADDATVSKAQEAGGLPGDARFRRLARICPYGMEQALTVSELMPSATAAEEEVLSNDDVAQYESALAAFTEGRWDEAFATLHAVPHWDQGKDFLTSHILQHGRQPPPNWDGVIRIGSK